MIFSQSFQIFTSQQIYFPNSVIFVSQLCPGHDRYLFLLHFNLNVPRQLHALYYVKISLNKH